MCYLEILDDNGNVKSYHLNSYEIIKEEESIIVKFDTGNVELIYELCPDTCFPSIEDIKEYLKSILETVVSDKYTLRISEFLARKYVSIGYEVDEEYIMKRFSVSKLN